MAHIHTAPGQHDQTVSAYVVRLDGDEPKIVVHRHKKLKRYLQFGGHVELDENPWQAIRHELREESGYDFEQLSVLQPPARIASLAGGVLHPVPVCYNTHEVGERHFHADASWAFVADGAPRHDVGPDESSDVRLLSRAELLDPSFDDVDASVRDVGRFIFDVCLPEWERVPADRWP